MNCLKISNAEFCFMGNPPVRMLAVEFSRLGRDRDFVVDAGADCCDGEACEGREKGECFELCHKVSFV